MTSITVNPVHEFINSCLDANASWREGLSALGLIASLELYEPDNVLAEIAYEQLVEDGFDLTRAEVESEFTHYVFMYRLWSPEMIVQCWDYAKQALDEYVGDSQLELEQLSALAQRTNCQELSDLISRELC